MHWLIALWCFQGPLVEGLPQPETLWTVAFTPDNALLRENGTTLLFQGANVYSYNEQGELQGNLTLVEAPTEVYSGPEDSIWVHGNRGLIKLDEEMQLEWQRDLDPPTHPPFAFRGHLVYVTGDHIQLIDAQEGNTTYGNFHNAPLVGLTVDGDIILIWDAEGTLSSWDPFTSEKKVIIQGTGQPLRYATKSPLNHWTLAYQGGLLRQLEKNMKKDWERNFFIDFAMPPNWLRGEEKDLLMVATKGRRLTVYAPNGHELDSLLIGDRPSYTLQWSADLWLAIPGREPLLIWYNAETRTFTREPLVSKINVALATDTHVFLLDNNDIIRLYQRSL